MGSGGNAASSQPAGVRSPQAKAAAAAAGKTPKTPTAALKDSNGVRTSVAAAGGKKPAVGAGAGGRRPATASAKHGGGGGSKNDAAGEQENLSGPSRSKEEIHEAMVALAGPSTVAQVRLQCPLERTFDRLTAWEQSQCTRSTAAVPSCVVG